MRGRRPSPSAKLARNVPSSARAAFSLTDFGLAHELLELGPDDVHVDRDAGILERQQADPEPALEKGRPVVGRALGQERSERRIVDDEALDDDPLPVEADTSRGLGRVAGGRDGADRKDGRVHDPNGGADP